MKVYCGILVLLLATIGYAEHRTWTNSRGKRMQAEFVKFEGAKAVLKRKKNGETLYINITSFSTADRAYLKKMPGYPTHIPLASKKNGRRKTSQSKAVVNIYEKIETTSRLTWGLIIAGALILNIPLMIFLGKWIFGDIHGFGHAIRFWLQPNWISWMRGEAGEDFWNEMKLFFFIALLVVAGIAEVYLLFAFIL